MDRTTGAGRLTTVTRLLGAGLLLLTLVAGTGNRTHAASSGNPPARLGIRPAAPARPGHQGSRVHRPAPGALPAAPANLSGDGLCLLQGAIMPSANVGANDNTLNEVTALATNDLWSVGTFYNAVSATYGTLIEHWTGPASSWVVVPSPNVGAGNNQLYAISALSANDVWAAGYYYTSGEPGHDATLIEHWDGSAWSVIPSDNLSFDSNNDLYGITAVAKDDIWAVGGYYNDQTGTTQTLVEHWNGTAWTVVPTPNSAGGVNSLYAVDAVTAKDVWAVGEFYNTSDFSYHALIEHWNGTAWAIVSTAALSSNNRYLYKVTALSATNVWAVGSTWDGSGIDQTLIEHWNGASWTVVPSANMGADSNNLYSIAAVSPTDIWAAGDYYNYLTDSYQTLVEHWDGSAWTLVASPNKGAADNDFYGIAALSHLDVWVVGGYTGPSSEFSGTTTLTLTTHYSPVCPQPPTTAPKS
jgi:hypothetical protein